MPSPINIIVALILLARGDFDYGCPCASETGAPAPAVKAEVGRPLPSNVKITRTNVFSSVSPSAKRYTVDCKLKVIATYKDRSNATLRCEPLDIPIPTITIADGEMVAIQDTSQRTFEIARTAKGMVPITREVWEGTKFDICVVGADDGKAVVDVNAVMQSANGAGDDAKSLPADNARSVRVQNSSGRMIECVKLGEKTTSSFEKDFGLEVVVKEASE